MAGTNGNGRHPQAPLDVVVVSYRCRELLRKRLLVRYDRRAEIHQAFLALGCCLVCFRRFQRSF
jgi:hypothetical protein